MPRLTAELIADSPQFMNPVRDWELCLRGNKIQVIENLGATLDQFDTIDLSDNEVRKVDGFPLLRRLKSVIMCNNRIVRLGSGLERFLPQLETLVLTNNNIEELSDIDPLSSIPTLTYLSLLRNPVVHKPAYRLYAIHVLPQLRVLDFRRIRQKERDKAASTFGGKKGEEKLKSLQRKAKTFNPGEPVTQAPPAAPPSGPSQQEITRIREAIANARSLDEVQHLEALLKAGQLPMHLNAMENSKHSQQTEEEEDEEMESSNGPVSYS